MSYYINEPLVQKIPYFVQFMGGMQFTRSTQALSKLTSAPKHWRGQRIEVKDRSRRAEEVSVTVFVDGFLEYCNHANQEIEHSTFNGGTDQEYGMSLATCQACGAGWDEDGEERLEPWATEKLIKLNKQRIK